MKNVKANNVRRELCWFVAACLGVGAYILVTAALEVGLAMSAERFTLIVLAGIAVALMTVFAIVARRMEERRSAWQPGHR